MLNSYINSQTHIINQFIVIDKDGNVVENESLFFEQSKTIGKSIKTLHPFFESIDIPEKNKDQEFYFKCVNIIFNKTRHIIDITIKAFKNDDNSLVIIDDLTSHYTNLEEVTQLRNETVINAQLLKYKNHILQEKERFKNRFIRSFSHEIRIPINTINRMCMRLANTNLSQTQHYNLNVVNNINDQIKHIINDILDISRIETGYFELQNTPFNVYDAIEHITALAKQKCFEKNLDFKYNIDKSCPYFLDGDQYRVTQILNNLIENAIKFTNEGSITLDVNVKNKTKNNLSLNFKITDTGIGIKKQELSSIFNGFYQIQNSKTIKDKGIGLGLSIVKHLTRALEGTITVESEVKKGTTFTVTLPYTISENQTIDKQALEEKKQLENALKILVADPFSKAKTELESIFNQKNYNLSFVESGDAVIESLYRSKYDAVIMNLKLPKMDGLDTVRYIRLSEDADFRDIPVIIVSANKNEEEERKCLKNKANAYLGKPYDKSILTKKINAILKESTP